MIQLAASPIIGALYSKGSEGQKDAFLSIFIVVDKLMIDVATSYMGERERDIGVFITLALKFIILFSYSLAYHLCGPFLNFYWLCHQVECPNVSTANCSFQKRVKVMWHGYLLVKTAKTA